MQEKTQVKTWSKRVVLPNLYLQSHLGLQMTGALQRKWIALSTLTEARCQDWLCWAETQMNWSRYIWLHVKLTRIPQKLRTSRIRWHCSVDIRAAAQQNKQYSLCAQRRLRSAWASEASDQSLRCQPGESLGPNSYPLNTQRRFR